VVTTDRTAKPSTRRVNRSGPYRDAESHKAIVRATWQMLEAVGYHDLTIDGVAGRAGVGKATIYRWWPSKGALVAEAIASHLNPEPAPETDDVRADLQASIQMTVDNYSGTIAGVAIPALLADLAFDADSYESFCESFLRPRRQASAAVVQRAIDAGLLPPSIDTALLLDFWAGATFYRVLISREPIGPDFAQALTNLILGQPPTTSASSTPPRGSASARTSTALRISDD
jgi:AcrR family transcriptional regulator